MKIVLQEMKNNLICVKIIYEYKHKCIYLHTAQDTTSQWFSFISFFNKTIKFCPVLN